MNISFLMMMEHISILEMYPDPCMVVMVKVL